MNEKISQPGGLNYVASFYSIHYMAESDCVVKVSASESFRIDQTGMGSYAMLLAEKDGLFLTLWKESPEVIIHSLPLLPTMQGADFFNLLKTIMRYTGIRIVYLQVVIEVSLAGHWAKGLENGLIADVKNSKQ